MSSKGNPSNLDLFWITRLILFFLFITLASATPIFDLGQAHPSRANPETELLYAPNQQDKGKPLTRRLGEPNLYATGWHIGQDENGNNIYGFGPSADGFTSGIVTIGKKLGHGSDGSIFEASLLTFNKPRILGTDMTSPEWGGIPTEKDQVQRNLAVKLSDSMYPYHAVRIIEKLKANNSVPILYKAMKVERIECIDDSIHYGSLIVMEKLEKSALAMLREYDTKPFNRLIMMQQWAKVLAFAHQEGIAHGDIQFGNLMKTFQPDDWRITDWDNAEDSGQKPGKT